MAALASAEVELVLICGSVGGRRSIFREDGM